MRECDAFDLQASVSDRNQLAEQLAQAQAQSPAPGQSTAPGVAPGGTPQRPAATPPGGVALQLVKVLQQQVGNLEGRLTAQDKQRKALKKVTSEPETEFYTTLHTMSYTTQCYIPEVTTSVQLIYICSSSIMVPMSGRHVLTNWAIMPYHAAFRAAMVQCDIT